MTDQAHEKARTVSLVAFDVDGVLTDGRLLLGDNGVEYKAFNTRDGLGIKLLLQAGIEVAIAERIGLGVSLRTVGGHDLSRDDFGAVVPTAGLSFFDVEPRQDQFLVGLRYRF